VAEDNLRTGYFASNRIGTDDIYEFSFSIIRKAACDSIEKNNYCYRFIEDNAAKNDSIPFRYEWKFGDGNKAEGPVVEHCYIKPGIYLVQLDIINLITNEVTYNEKTDTLDVTDIVQPYISGPDIINAGQEIMLSADSTNLPGWKIGQYYWNFDDETVAFGKEVNKTYLKPGKYNVQLIVSTEPEPGGALKEDCVSKNIIVLRQP
jgi:PKD repeat protein